ncbi:ShlB/FhaC/HecB family hemolysin secretion/activation protein, partial [Acinetobacter guillouiae]|uniref:ShlB/FhaC/HecB family hemolysin secretion/activation protein n=1 Tax=Acinetobacter guillouiae TaxID=106649 RepID=UPI003AF699CA
RYTVRGFDGEQTLLADNGFLVRNELSGSIMNKPHSWYAGIDYGEVGGKTAHYPNPLPGTSLLGAVIGLRGQIAPLRTMVISVHKIPWLFRSTKRLIMLVDILQHSMMLTFTAM